MILVRVGRIFDRVDADAILVQDDRIHRLGRFAELRREFAQAKLLEFPRALALPGLHDTHTHFYEWAKRRQSLDLRPAADFAALEHTLRQAAQAWRERPDPEWIGGGGWDPDRYGKDPRVSRLLLDEIFGERPVALESRDFHTLWCNSAALRRAGVGVRPTPAGGRIGVGPDGPDGFLYEMAWELIWAVRPAESESTARRWLLDAQAAAHRLGITSLHSMEPGSSLRHFQRLDAAAELTLRICFHTPLDELASRVERAERSYAPAVGRLRLGGVKIFMDGSLGSGSAWMRDPRPGGGTDAPLRPMAELKRLLRQAAAAGIAGTVHAIGDRCVEEVADCLARVQLECGPLPHRIEHAQCTTPLALARMARAGIRCAVQPVHLFDDIPLLKTRWGKAAAHAYPLRSMCQAGVRFGLGSDAPVASLDWRAGLFAAVARRSPGQKEAFGAEQCLTLDEALRGYTSWAAELVDDTPELGRLEPGALADLCLLEDPGEDLDAWLVAPIQLTMVGGEIVYEA